MQKVSSQENNVLHHTQKVKVMFDDLIQHLRDDTEIIKDIQAKAMFETSAEVIAGLKKTFEHYENGKEKAWQK